MKDHWNGVRENWCSHYLYKETILLQGEWGNKTKHNSLIRGIYLLFDRPECE
jgi:hypothetical protein